jgi:predicted homoserine dehydrogenase-like protein
LGFEVIAAGKGKNNPLDRTATPDRLTDEAREKNMSPKMLCSFVDGTKTMVEMTALANATGLIPDVRGMHGPQATLDDLPRIFAPREEGGILSRTGVVEYVLGDVAPGVFVVITTQDPVIAADLRYLRLGPGPRWVLYRPYHLANLEVPLSVARAVLLNEPTICPRPRPVAEAITIAKRDLHAGEQIDGLGGFTVYGSIDRAETAREEGLLPLGLAPGSVLRRDVPQGAPLHLSDVELDKNQMIVALRRMQDRLLYAEL